jgi:glycosyltransferase involved in cell wall biosynthesis
VVDVCNGLPFLTPLYVRKRIIALVHHVHREQWPVVLGRYGARFGWWVESWLAPRVYRRCQYVTVSEATRADLATIGVDPRSVAVVYNGTPAMPPSTAPRATSPTLVVLGRLVPHKRVELALEAVAALLPEYPDLRLTVAGQGWWEPKLRELAADLDITSAVTFSGFVNEQQKRDLLGAAWLSLAPSLKEGWGLTIVEAAACGTPTVAFGSAGGVAEALVHGHSGLLADDSDEFIAHIRTLVTDPSLREKMGAAAQAHAGGFTWDISGARFAALIAAPASVPMRLSATATEPLR